MIVNPSSTPAQGAAGTQIQAAAAQSAVLDADTLRLGNQVVRLQGIAAPARGSICHGDSQTEYDCGSAAANALASLVQGTTIACTIQGHDRFGRPIGDCEAGGRPLSRALVRDGWVRATEAGLRAVESEARAAQRGIWHPLGQT